MGRSLKVVSVVALGWMLLMSSAVKAGDEGNGERIPLPLDYHEQGLDRWIRDLKDEDPLVRRQAAQKIGALGRRANKAFLPLFEALKDKDEHVREAVAKALKRVEPRFMEFAIQALTDAKPSVRGGAAVTLAYMGLEAGEAVPALVQVLKEEDDDDVRLAAIFALASIGPKAKPSIPALIQIVKDDQNPICRKVAIMALGLLDSEGKSVQALRAALRDEDAQVRDVASAVLKQKAPEAPGEQNNQ